MQLNRIGRPLFANVFARIFGVDEQDAVSTVAPEVMPTTSPWERPEFWALIGGQFGQGSTAAGAFGAGTQNRVALQNPANSGVLIIVEAVRLNNASEYTLQLVQGGSLGFGFTSVGASHRDSRRRGSTLFDGIAGQVGALNGGAPLAMTAPSRWTGPVTIEIPFIIEPNFHLHIQGGDNQATDVSVLWRERAAQPDELIRL